MTSIHTLKQPAAMQASDGDIELVTRLLKAIAHPLRLKILCVLGHEEVSVLDIVERVGTSQSNISQHLGLLRDKGILVTRKDANRVYYRMGDQRTLQLLNSLQDIFCKDGSLIPAAA